MRYHIELAYNGTPFHGWQRQPNAPSVQEILNEKLTLLLRTPCETLGCGRTDAGVHSSRYIAHFEYDGDVDMNKDFIYHLNSCLPAQIAVYKIYPNEKHARFDAKSREYKYIIARKKDPFAINQCWQLTIGLDEQVMQIAADKLLQYSDFTSFARIGSDNRTNICKITQAEWSFSPERYVFTITADRFLRGMVRAIVGTLIDVGRAKITLDEFVAIIEAKNRGAASSAAPPDGLFLTQITY